MRKLILTAIFAATSSGAGAANLLLNHGFESGLTDWVTSGNAAIRTNNPLAYEGLQYIYGSATPQFSISQTVDLLAEGLDPVDIDAGGLRATFGGWQAGYTGQTDYGIIGVVLLDDQLAALGSSYLNPFYTNDQSWVEQTGDADLISGTRYIRYEFDGYRVSGSNDDGYLDAAYLQVTQVPIPAAIWLFGAALAGLGWIGRKQTAESRLYASGKRCSRPGS